jgi:acyl-CoA thioesterase I
LLLLIVQFGIGQLAHAAGCPVPDPFVIADDALPASKLAAEGRALTILVLGGAATLGGPAQGAAFTYPSRLEARLRDALPGVAVKVDVHAVSRETAARR